MWYNIYNITGVLRTCARKTKGPSMFATMSAIVSIAFELISKFLRSAFAFLSAFCRMTISLVQFAVLLSLVAMFIRLILHMTGIFAS